MQNCNVVRERERELREGVAMALASLALDQEDHDSAREACRKIETAVLSSGAGPMGWGLLEAIDARLRDTLGEHDLLVGRYA